MSRFALITIALVSFATVLLELVQTRILSFIFWNHQVYLTLSVAMLGFGVSGSLTAVCSSKWQKNVNNTLSLALCLLGTSAIISLFAIYCLPFLEKFGYSAKILCCYVFNLFPFVFAGAIISIVLMLPKVKIGQLYAADLVSASLACVAFFFLLPVLRPDRIIALIAIASGLLAFGWAGKSKKLELVSVGVAEAGALLFILFSFYNVPVFPEEYKELHKYLTWRGSSIETTVWTPLARIDVTSNPAFKEITQDGSAHTFLQSTSSIAESQRAINEHRDMYPGTLAFSIKEKPDVAVIGVGGGIDVVNAINYGANSVLGAEINPATYDFFTRRYANYNGQFAANPRIKIVNDEGRSMLAHENKDFDIVQIIGVDTFAALSSGAYVLSENYLYTVEAFQTFMKHLRKDGILSFARINSFPPKESIRLVSLGCEALKRNGSTTTAEQIMVFITDNDWAVCLFKNSPFTKGEVSTLAQSAKNRGVPVVYWPKVYAPEKQSQLENNYYQLQPSKIKEINQSFDGLIAAYQNGTEKRFFENYPSLVKPTTDDLPFFFEYNKPEFSLSNFEALRGTAPGATLWIVILESIVFSSVAVFWPLWKFKRDGMAVPAASLFSLYFACIGAAFLLIEVSLIQKCVLFLGSPLYSLPVTLASLLLSAGIGSWMIGKSNWKLRKIVLIFGTSFVCIMTLGLLLLNSVFYSLIYLALPARMLITFLLILPVGICMGTFFQAGLVSVKERSEQYIPWAWGINGCFSVFGSFAAILLAISFGFTTTLVVGLAIYIVAFLTGFKISEVQNT